MRPTLLFPLALLAVACCSDSSSIAARTSPPPTLANGVAASIARLRLDKVP
ncbi:MAG TPA: hypothetical protein VK348_13915 [Planctomycetota bacterium]|nr:hypothetical protein [Planctomycetota bacterium]